MNKIKQESTGMASNYAAEKEKMDERMKEMEREARRERQRSEAEYRRLQETSSASRAERERLQWEIRRLQNRLNESDSDDDGWCVVLDLSSLNSRPLAEIQNTFTVI
jgi:hypothetical protein